MIAIKKSEKKKFKYLGNNTYYVVIKMIEIVKRSYCNCIVYFLFFDTA